MPRKSIQRLFILAAFTAATVAAARATFAQTVRGHVFSAEGDVALAGATVTAIAADGTIATQAVTDDDGDYAIRVKRPGRLRLLVRRIGFAPDSADVALESGREAAFNTMLRLAPLQLSELPSRVPSRCDITPEAGAMVLTRWDAIRRALPSLDAGPERAKFVVRRYQRESDPWTAYVWEQKTWTEHAEGIEAFAPAPPESLATYGYSVRVRDSLLYRLPDARTLLSETFARTHCFHPVDALSSEGVPRHGLAFAPVKATDRTDVVGIVWLDSTSTNLAGLEFTYTGKTPLASLGFPSPSGRVEYARLISGRTIVRHWDFALPVLGGGRHFTRDSRLGKSKIAAEMVDRMPPPRGVSSLVNLLQIGGDLVKASTGQ